MASGSFQLCHLGMWLELHYNFVLNAPQWHQEAFCYAILESGWKLHYNFVLNAPQWHQKAFCYAILECGWNSIITLS